MPAAHEPCREHRRPAYENLQWKKPRWGYIGVTSGCEGQLARPLRSAESEHVRGCHSAISEHVGLWPCRR
jgi:hypothetical protein